MKRILYTFSLFIVILYVTGHFFIFKISLLQHRAYFKSHLLNNGHTTRVIKIFPYELYTDSKNIEWQDNNEEIRYENKIYDIVATKNSDGKVWLYVINDEDENRLFAEFVKQWNEMHTEQSNTSDTTDELTELLDLDFLFEFQKLKLLTAESTIAYPHLSSKLFKGFLSVIYIPPIN